MTLNPFRLISHAVRAWKGKPGDWMEGRKTDAVTGRTAPRGMLIQAETYYDPDVELAALLAPIPNPVLETNVADIASATLFEGCFDEDGRLLRDKRVLEGKGARAAGKPYRLVRYDGAEAAAALEAAATRFEALPAAAKVAREAKRAHAQKIVEAIRAQRAAHAIACTEAKEAGLPEPAMEAFDDDIWGGGLSQYDANQYTEFTPLWGGPYNRQLYLADYLAMAARAFEAWNHQPLAKRIINLYAQYSLGRGYKARFDEPKAEKVFKKRERETKLKRKLPVWTRELCIFGEIFIDKKTWLTIDPAAVLDIICDPDTMAPYYYHLQYQTPFTMYTGKTVAGAPAGAAKAPSTKYVIKQIPADQIIHIKIECVSTEKRGRSLLFPILGWLKRLKDLYNAKVIKAQLEASFIWDDTIDGDDADVANHAAAYASMPLPGSTFAHNKAVERKAMQAATPSGGGDAYTGNEILAFIATAAGVPKDFFNLVASGGGQGSRAGAVMGSEPFTKVIEDTQEVIEDLLHQIAAAFLEEEGTEYDPDKVEFIFPSVTKDTTSEALKNIQTAESAGYIDKETAATMAAGELNITKYDFDATQEKIRQQVEDGLAGLSSSPPPTPGRFGQGGPAADGEDGEDEGGSPIHGDDAAALKRELAS